MQRTNECSSLGIVVANTNVNVHIMYVYVNSDVIFKLSELDVQLSIPLSSCDNCLINYITCSCYTVSKKNTTPTNFLCVKNLLCKPDFLYMLYISVSKSCFTLLFQNKKRICHTSKHQLYYNLNILHHLK